MDAVMHVLELMLFTSPAHLAISATDANASISTPHFDSKPSPLNKDLVLPEDIYSAILWVMFWSVAHACIYRLLIQPLSNYLIPDPDHSTKKSLAKPRRSTHLPKSSTVKQRKNHNHAKLVPTDPSSLELEEISSKDDSRESLESITKERGKLQLAMWKFSVYAITVAVGAYTLFQEDWWSSPELYFKGYPHFTSNTMKIYYNIGFGNYAYQLYTIFYEPKQSDFWQMFTHHVCTLAVMGVSYFTSFTRIGAVILLLHDIADPIMEFAKCWLYCKQQMMADIFFAVFALTFLVTRNFVFPYYVISACIPYGVYEDGERMPRGYSQYFWICVGCLWLLQLLNLNWGFLIMKMVVKAVRSGGKVEKDIRDE